MKQRQTPPVITTSQKNMKANMVLSQPLNGEEDFTVEEIRALLLAAGITYGIDDVAIDDMLRNKRYDESICVAKGLEPVNGIDGYYEYHFNKDLNRKPTEKADGSVDYWSISLIATVEEGQTIVQYHPAVQGKSGMSVRGDEIPAAHAKEQPPLKGRGFERNEEDNTYVALMSGKIEMQRDHIVINPVHEVNGDVDMRTGNIKFPGDVLVHGNVCSGVTIESTDTVTVDGIIEGATIIAGKDVVIRNGVKGGSQAKIIAKGCVLARYIEYATVEAEGMIQADAIVDSIVHSGEAIALNGRHGSIVGGSVSAVSEIEAREIGNESEVRTVISVGAQLEILQRIEALQKNMTATQDNIERIEKGLSDFDALVEQGTLQRDDPRRMQLMKVKIRDTAQLAADKAELQSLDDIIVRSHDASIAVLDKVFPRTEVGINRCKVIVKEYQQSVRFVQQEDKIVMQSMLSK